MNTNNGFVWVFVGANSRFPSGIFISYEAGEEWIMTYKLSGVITKYPLNVGAYDWAIAQGFFSPKKIEHSSPLFIGKFTCASMEHYHFECGVRDIAVQ